MRRSPDRRRERGKRWAVRHWPTCRGGPERADGAGRRADASSRPHHPVCASPPDHAHELTRRYRRSLAEDLHSPGSALTTTAQEPDLAGDDSLPRYAGTAHENPGPDFEWPIGTVVRATLGMTRRWTEGRGREGTMAAPETRHRRSDRQTEAAHEEGEWFVLLRWSDRSEPAALAILTLSFHWSDRRLPTLGRASGSSA